MMGCESTYMIDAEAENSLQALLARLETQIDPAEQQDIRARHLANATWCDVARPPLLVRFPWDQQAAQTYPPAEAIIDPAKMLTNEFLKGFMQVEKWLAIKDDTPLQIRPDFGIGLVSAVFGRCVEAVGDNPPWVRPLQAADSSQAVEQMLDQLDLDTLSDQDWVKRVEATYVYYTEALKAYPNIAASVAITLPDLQGPLDNADLIWGSDIFLAVLDNVDLVNRLLTAVSDTMVLLFERFSRWTTETNMLPAGFCHQHGSIVRGNLLLRCDSCVITGPLTYDALVFPYDEKTLQRVDGGSFHSCGKWSETAARVIASPLIGSVDFGLNQSHLNDVDHIYALAREHKKHLNLVTPQEDELRSGSLLERFPQGVTFAIEAQDIKHARVLTDYYRNL